MQDTVETHSKSQEDCTKLSSDDLRNLSRNNWLIMNDKVNNNPLTVAAPGGFLGFLETSQDSGSTDQIVNTDGPLPAAVTVNKTP